MFMVASKVGIIASECYDYNRGRLKSTMVGDGYRCRLRFTWAAMMAMLQRMSLSPNKSFYIYRSSTILLKI